MRNNAPIRHFRLDLNAAIPDARAFLGREACALHGVNHCASGGVTDRAARAVIARPVEYALSVLCDIPVVWASDVEGTVGDVVDCAVEHCVHADVVRCEGGHDVQLSVFDKGVVLRGSGHFEFAVAKKNRNKHEIVDDKGMRMKRKLTQSRPC